MKPAEQWVRDYSKANSSARSLMFALARFAEGCVVVCTALDLRREARISRPQLYRCLAWLEELREIERLTKHGENRRFRRFHMVGFCESPSLMQKCSVSYRKQSRVSDLKTPSLQVSSLLPFPRSFVSADECEECRGSGYRDFTILAHDGQPQKVAIRCNHEVASIAGRWRPIETWQDRFLLPELPRASEESGARQMTLAEFQERLRQDELKRRREQIPQEHLVAPASQTPVANVIVMNRKTA